MVIDYQISPTYIRTHYLVSYSFGKAPNGFLQTLLPRKATMLCFCLPYVHVELKIRAFKYSEHLLKNKPVNLHLRPIRAFLDNACTKTTQT